MVLMTPLSTLPAAAERSRLSLPLLSAPGGTAAADALGRPLHDLRISVTDRCNFRCTYCMPRSVFGKDYAFLPMADLLTFPEITRLAAVFAGLGVRKLRITGGEPLLRKDVTGLIRSLAAIPGIDDLTLTTNGSLLTRHVGALKAAGLHRVTVSLDALDEDTFRRMNDVDFPAARVLEGIEAARAEGLGPVKVNMVVRRGVNEDQIVPMARYLHGTGCILRFIEFMDVGTTNGWRTADVVTAEEILARLEASGLPLEPLPANYRGEVAARYGYRDGSGEVGVIASVTRPFCGDCSRARLSAEGRLYTCLFASRGHDLRGLLRDGSVSDAEITEIVRGIWSRRTDRYSEERGAATTARPKVEMSHIGG
jgi:cyclic pyranopterin phosphate synthase